MPEETSDAIETPVVGVETVASFVEYDPVTGEAAEGSTPVEVSCTNKINLDPPEQPRKFVACRLDGTAYSIPQVSKPGTLSFTALDFANKDKLRGIHNKRLIVTLVTSRSGVTLLTDTCTDWKCKISIDHPENSESTISANGEFKTYDSQTADTGSS